MGIRLVKKKLAPDFWIFYFCDDVDEDDILSCYYLKYKDTFSCPFINIFFCERLFDLKKNCQKELNQILLRSFLCKIRINL